MGGLRGLRGPVETGEPVVADAPAGFRTVLRRGGADAQRGPVGGRGLGGQVSDEERRCHRRPCRPDIERRAGKGPRGAGGTARTPCRGPPGDIRQPRRPGAPSRCAVPLPASRSPRGQLSRCLLDPAGALRRVVEGALPRFRAVIGKSSTSKRYTAEFRRDVVAPVRSSGRTVPGGAREAAVSPEGLRNRVSQDKAVRGRGGPSAGTSSAWVVSSARRITRAMDHSARSPGTVRI
ncbi:transposase [Streptomyces prasinus]|uniref:transposase n=1 Tax=Streptomyces prasinus TaxID=67345 RepID=UPI000A9BD18E